MSRADSVIPSDSLIGEVEAAVRRYFSATVEGNQPERYSTGKLEEIDRLRSISFAEETYPHATFRVDDLEVTLLDGGSAEVSLKAEALYALDHAVLGPKEFRTEYCGPVIARSTAEGWKIVDYVRNGRSILESVFLPVNGAAILGNTLLEALAVELRSEMTGVFIRVENGEAIPIRLLEVTLGHAGFLRTRWTLGYGWRDLSVPPNDSITVAAGWSWTLPVSTRGIRVVFTIERNGRPARADLKIDMARH